MSDTPRDIRRKSYGNSRNRRAGLKRRVRVKGIFIGFTNLKIIKVGPK